MTARSAPVLLVDVEPGLRQLVRWHIEAAGYRVDEVVDGATALAQLPISPRALIVVMNTLIPSVNARDNLRAGADDETLQRHGFVLVTELAHMLPNDLWGLTGRLGVPVVAKNSLWCRSCWPAWPWQRTTLCRLPAARRPD